MAKANFDSYLDIEVESIERPQAPPVGHYSPCRIAAWKQGERAFNKDDPSKKTPVIEIFFQLGSPEEDARENAESFGVDAESFVGRTVSRDYDLSDPQGQFGLRRMAEDTCSLDVKGLKLREVLDQLKGQEVKLYMEQRVGREEGEFFPKVSKVLPVD